MVVLVCLTIFVQKMKGSIDGLQKSAIIYRDDSATFIYVCFHCGCMFNEINETLQHIESHFQLASVVVEQPVDDVTAFNSDFTVDIKEEILDNEDDNPLFAESISLREFRCKICGVIELSRFSLRVHALSDHIHEPMECHYCACSSYKSIVDFENHLTSHMATGEVDWRSVIDGIQTRTLVDWSVYEGDVTLETDTMLLVRHELVKIETPSQPSSSNKSLKGKIHRKGKSKRRVYTSPYQCHKCSQKFRYAKALRSHFERHASDSLLETCKCKKCDNYYENSFTLRLHVLEHHQNTETFSCKACGSVFTHLQTKQFEEHLQRHNGSGTKLWPDIRDGIYQQNENCVKYEEIYSFIDEQFSCEFCTERFHLKCNLDAHMKSTHSGQRRLQCGQCQSVFTTPKVISLFRRLFMS